MSIHPVSHDLKPMRMRIRATGCHLTVPALIGVLLCLVCIGSPPASAVEIDIADAPMLTRLQPPPADIMIVLDDSGSMSFEVLVSDEYDGSYPDPDRRGQF